MTEKLFIAALNGGNGGHQYRLAEYVTSFVLARDIELEFTEVDVRTVRSALGKHPHSFLFFESSSAITRGHTNSKVTIGRTANGMRIKIPGTQLIGYITQKLPRFPYKQE